MKWNDFDTNKNPFPETIRIIADWLWFISTKWHKIEDKNKFIEQNLQPLITGKFRDPQIKDGELKYPSPALGTLIRYLGFIDNNYTISRLVELVAQHKLTVAEYIIVILSKHRGWIDGVPTVNFLVLLCMYLRANDYCDVSTVMLEELSKVDGYDLIPTAHFEKNRNDLLYNYIKETGLFDEHDHSLALKPDAKEIIDFIANNKERIGVDARTDKNECYIYYGDLTSGIFKLDGLELPAAWRHFFPHLLRCKSSYMFDGKHPLQKIFYGCPGSGKSYKVKEITAKIEPEYVFRTTFHPDYDYASFVGCYKPISTSNMLNYTKEQLIDILTKMKASGDAYPIQKFSVEYYYALESLTKAEREEIVEMAGFSYSYNVEMDKSIAAGKYIKHIEKESTIVYKFAPQFFTDAYIKAWEDEKRPVYLIIEEINRGNCAQIFGDLFQLLDRNKETGRSEYSIKVDKDLAKYIESQLGSGHEGIKEGKLCLSSNLIIYATMNTSDQSLFPMDSAFKRRWDWEYVPINYSDSVESGKFTITIEDGTTKKEYKWVDFLKLVNDKIYNATNSEDKQMGNFFIKKSVDTNEFVNKVMFYLWNEVCKEEYGTQRNFFRRGDKGETEFKFTELFGNEKGKILNEFMSSLSLKPMSTHTPDNDDTPI